MKKDILTKEKKEIIGEYYYNLILKIFLLIKNLIYFQIQKIFQKLIMIM